MLNTPNVLRYSMFAVFACLFTLCDGFVKYYLGYWSLASKTDRNLDLIVKRNDYVHFQSFPIMLSMRNHLRQCGSHGRRSFKNSCVFHVVLRVTGLYGIHGSAANGGSRLYVLTRKFVAFRINQVDSC